MKQVFKRIMAETPTYFKRVRLFGLSLSAAGASITAISGVPENVTHYAGEAIWMGAVIAIVAQMACAKPEDLK